MYIGFSDSSTETFTIAQNSTKFSTPFKFDKCNGFADAFVTVTAGSVSISQQCGQTIQGPWFDPVDKTNTAIGVVCTTMAVGTRWVQFDPVLAPFARFKVVETNVGSTTVTFRPMYMEDR